MEVKLYRPKNPLLEPYIECFYTLRRDDHDESVTYIAFPNIFSMVCLNARAEIEQTEGSLIFRNCPRNELQTTLILDFEYSGAVRYEGATDEIVIYFKPLGLNAFLEKNLKEYTSGFFAHFSPFKDYKVSMSEIFKINGDKDRIHALENYWLSHFRGFEHPFLHRVIDQIVKGGGSSPIAETAARNKVSRTTLLRQFDLQIGTSPSQFRKIVRFRNAMKLHRERVLEENLTDISHGSDYFDQSHMIKDFRALTNYSPKDFFSKLSTLEDGNINWLFL